MTPMHSVDAGRLLSIKDGKYHLARLWRLALVAALLLMLCPAVIAQSSLPIGAWNAGNDAFKAGRFSEAESKFKTVTRLAADWQSGHYMLGRTLLQLKRPKEASSELEVAYKLSPTDPNIALWLAEAYLHIWQPKKALSVLNEIGTDGLPPTLRPFGERLRMTALREVGESPLPNNQQQADQSASTSPARSPARKKGCLKLILHKYCLGGPASKLPKASAEKGNNFMYMADPSRPVMATVQGGTVAVVVIGYATKTYLQWRDLDNELRSIYGSPSSNADYFPDYADTPSSKATAVDVGSARSAHTWQEKGWSVQLQWTKSILAILYKLDTYKTEDSGL